MQVIQIAVKMEKIHNGIIISNNVKGIFSDKGKKYHTKSHFPTAVLLSYLGSFFGFQSSLRG